MAGRRRQSALATPVASWGEVPRRHTPNQRNCRGFIAIGESRVECEGGGGFGNHQLGRAPPRLAGRAGFIPKCDPEERWRGESERYGSVSHRRVAARKKTYTGG